MAGFFTRLFHAGANIARDNLVISPEELETRENGKKVLEMVKLATIVAVAVSVLLFAIIPKIFTFCLIALTAFAANEIYNVADNILEMLNQFAVEVLARSSKNNLIAQLTKNTIATRPIIELMNLDLSSVLLS